MRMEEVDAGGAAIAAGLVVAGRNVGAAILIPRRDRGGGATEPDIQGRHDGNPSSG